MSIPGDIEPAGRAPEKSGMSENQKQREENERLQSQLSDPGTTHTTGCWNWGPKHYACAAAEVERLRAALDDIACGAACLPGFGIADASQIAQKALSSSSNSGAEHE